MKLVRLSVLALLITACTSTEPAGPPTTKFSA